MTDRDGNDRQSPAGNDPRRVAGTPSPATVAARPAGPRLGPARDVHEELAALDAGEVTLPPHSPRDFWNEIDSRHRSAAFEPVLAHGWELVLLRRRAAAAYARRPALDHPGFGALLDAVLGDVDPASFAGIAAAVGLHPVALADVRAYDGLATDFRSEPIITLAQALGLDEATFLTLVTRDLVSRADARLESTPEWPSGAPAPGLTPLSASSTASGLCGGSLRPRSHPRVHPTVHERFRACFGRDGGDRRAPGVDVSRHGTTVVRRPRTVPLHPASPRGLPDGHASVIFLLRRMIVCKRRGGGYAPLFEDDTGPVQHRRRRGPGLIPATLHARLATHDGPGHIVGPTTAPGLRPGPSCVARVSSPRQSSYGRRRSTCVTG